mgnify:CR=1 FL=1
MEIIVRGKKYIISEDDIKLNDFIYNSNANVIDKCISNPSGGTMCVEFYNGQRAVLSTSIYKKAIKKAMSTAMRMGADGIKVAVGGRLNGAEIARKETFKEGRTPLHTLRADIDYATSTAHTTYGCIGVKVWICKGEIMPRKKNKSNDKA